MTEVLAVIPARGGSKSLPRKNILPLGGIPLIGHTIKAARAASLVTRVAVSTEDSEIAVIAERFGAEVVPRPRDLATDEASSESALIHALDHLEVTEGYRPDILCFLQCTSPLTASEDIDGVIHSMLVTGADTALAVTRFHHFVWRRDDFGEAIGVNHEKSIRLRRQDRHEEFLETGAVYAMDAKGFRSHQHRFFGKTILHEMPASRVLEIDEPEDFDLAAGRLRVDTSQISQGLPRKIEGIAFDFDGVFTDDRVLVDEEGAEAVFCSRRDGLGIEMLRKTAIPLIVLSKERNLVVARRCEKLGLEYVQGQDSKIFALNSWITEHRLNPKNVIYLGNDINDLECMAVVGCSVAPADGHPSALAAADLILRSRGGKGAIRELADLVLGRK